MRSIIFLLTLLLANTMYSQDNVYLSGHINNRVSDTLEISYNDNNLAYYPKTFYALLDKKGNFNITFPVPAHVYIQAELKYSNKIAEVVLQGGDSLRMTVNYLGFDSSIHYTGKGAEVQNFVARHTIEKGRMNQYTSKLKQAINEEPKEFIVNIDKERKAEMTFLEKNKAHLPAPFIEYWKAFYRYYNYFFIQQYPQTHEILKLKRMTDTVSPGNYVVVKEMPYAFSDSFLQLPPYLLYLTGVFETKLKADGFTAYKADTMKQRMIEDSVYGLGYKLLPDRSAEFFMAQNLYGRAKDQSIERTRAQYQRYKIRWPKSQYLSFIDKQVATAERLAPGQPAPDFDLFTPDGNHIKLSDLKGNIVYLGFWASFCRPCVGEMISERKIKDLLKNKPVKFVYVSIDNDSTLDNSIAKKYKIDGVFTHAANSWASKEVELYGVQNLPAYFLIDEDGKIAVQRPYSPGFSTDLILQIGKLLK